MNEPIVTNKNKHNAFGKFRNSTSFGIVLILIGLCIVLSIATPGSFLTKDNLMSTLRQFSFIAMVAIGECLVIITSGIDLSVGSVYALAGVIGALFMTEVGGGALAGMLIGAAAGAVFGFANGIFITKLRLPPIIATLGTMSIARGLAQGITNGYPVSNLPSSFKLIGTGYILGIPAPVVLLAVMTIIVGIFLHKSVPGRRIYATGGSEEAARVSGVRVNRIIIMVYTLCGLFAAIAGLATAARLGVAQSTAGQGLELDAIAAVIIGGASVNGGTGNIAGPVLGAAIMGILRNGLVLLSVSAYWQQAVIGVVIIIAVTFDKMRYSKAHK